MLHQTLEEASRGAKRKRLIAVAMAAGVAIAGVVVIFGASMYLEVLDLRGRLAASPASEPAFNEPDSTPAPALAEPARVEPAPLFPAPDEADQARLEPSRSIVAPGPAASEPSPLPPPIGSQPKIQPIPQATDGGPKSAPPESTDDAQVKRETFKQALKTFTGELEPQVSSQSFDKWAPNDRKDIEFLKSAAIAAFSAGNFDKALKSIGDATARARASLAGKQAAYELARKTAQQALDDDNVGRAETEIAKALTLAPATSDLETLKEKIAALPKVLKHLKAADVAKAENNLQREHDHIKNALKLAPTRTELKARLTTLATSMRENAFSRHIMSGDEHVRNRNLSAARRSADAARRIFSKRDELTMLTAQITALDNDIKMQKALGGARTAAVRDDWRAALQAFEDARKLQPTNADAVNGAKLAAAITALDAKISTHLGAPQRLAAPNVAAIADALIAQSQAVRGESASLDAKTSELKRQREVFSAKVPVLVLSDGLSHIIVEGVGQVGVTRKKTIRLKPGDYVFESTRPGYRSKLVKVSVPPTAKPFTIEIFCNERI